MSELKPCPFCGAEAHGYEIEAHQHSPALLALCPGLPPEPEGRYVIEGRCACGSGLIGDSQEEVTERWNRRALPAQAGQVLTDADWPDVDDMAHSAVQEALAFGLNHDVFYRYGHAVLAKAQIAAEQAVLAKRVPMPPEDWSVFNSGAEVASGLTWAEAWDYMTPSRIERGWTAVCVANKSNIGIGGEKGGA